MSSLQLFILFLLHQYVSSEPLTSWTESIWKLPQPIADVGCGYDSITNKIYLYGGRTSSDESNAVFSYNFDGTTTYSNLAQNIGNPYWYFGKAYTDGPYFYFFANNSFGQFHPSTQTITYPLSWNNNEVPILTGPYTINYNYACLEITNNGRYLIVLGGDGISGNGLAHMQIYDTINQIWSTGTDMQEKRILFTCTIDQNNILYAIGGDGSDSIEFVDISDITNIGSWTYISTTLSVQTKDFRSILFNQQIYIIGGRSTSQGGKGVPFVYALDTNTHALDASVQNLPIDLEAQCVTVVDGTIWILGGDDDWDVKKDLVYYSNLLTSEPTTASPTTAIPSTYIPTTIIPTTFMPTPIQSTTAIPTTFIPTTYIPTTVIPTTFMPSTSIPTTIIPTTIMPTSIQTTTIIPSTSLPTTIIPTTVMPTTAVPTTIMPTSDIGTTSVSSTNTLSITHVATSIKVTAQTTDDLDQGEVGDLKTSQFTIKDKQRSGTAGNLFNMATIIFVLVVVLISVSLVVCLSFVYLLVLKKKKKDAVNVLNKVSSQSMDTIDVGIATTDPITLNGGTSNSGENNKNDIDYEEFATPMFDFQETPQFPTKTNDLNLAENENNDDLLDDDDEDENDDLWINTNNVTEGGDIAIEHVTAGGYVSDNKDDPQQLNGNDNEDNLHLNTAGFAD